MVSTQEGTAHNPLQHTIVIWVVLLGLLVGGFAVAIISLNATVYSAGGFVSSYLAALQRHDFAAAISTPGVRATANAEVDLLTADALGNIADVSIVSDVDLGGGIHEVTYSATLGASSVVGVFEVQQEASRFGVFSSWSFLQSPMSVLSVTPMNDSFFTANGVDIDSPNGPSLPASFQVLTPGFFTVSHTSAYLTADPVSATVSRPGSVVPVTLDIRPSDEFVSAMQTQVDSFLDECTTQEVLFPTGCPFGQELSNRVESTPKWSMATYPQIAIEPGSDRGTWVIPEAQGAAHLIVDVRSLFDGTLSTFDEDVQFSLSWLLTISNDRVDIQQQ